MATNDEKEEMVALFKSLDTDHNGTLCREELKAGFERVFGVETENIDEEVDKIFREIDIDGSGEIDYSEFVTAAMNRQNFLTKDRLESAFGAFDTDQSGAISIQELKAALGRYIKADEWDDMIRDVDINGDGEIDFDEFYQMMNVLNS